MSAELTRSTQLTLLQDLTREESRRVAVESQIADITTERDCFRLQCATLTAKLMRQDMDINRLRMEQGRACRGCERQPQAPGTADGPYGSDATEVDKGQSCMTNHPVIGSSVCLGIAAGMCMTPGSSMGIMPIDGAIM